MAKFYLDLRKFYKFRRLIAQGSRGPLRPTFKQWGTRYLSWTKKLFDIKSKGGTAEGVSWPKLKRVSYRRATGMNLRRTRGGGRRGRRMQQKIRERRAAANVSILKDTGTLYKALSVGSPGNLFKYISEGVRVGFGGPARHESGQAKIRDIAVYHDTGEGKLPNKSNVA